MYQNVRYLKTQSSDIDIFVTLKQKIKNGISKQFKELFVVKNKQCDECIKHAELGYAF